MPSALAFTSDEQDLRKRCSTAMTLELIKLFMRLDRILNSSTSLLIVSLNSLLMDQLDINPVGLINK